MYICFFLGWEMVTLLPGGIYPEDKGGSSSHVQGKLNEHNTYQSDTTFRERIYIYIIFIIYIYVYIYISFIYVLYIYIIIHIYI